ncbi:MAG: cohesin domain-containing protein [Thermoanaerobaculia bacterium]|nr:cohesin domain-containing protein [Thermoanaerobaculia bacterium]
MIGRTVTFALALTFVAAFEAGAQTLSVGSVSARCGQTIQMPVTMSGASGLLALEFRLYYDASKLTLNSVVAGSLTSGFSLASNGGPGSVKVAMATGSGVSGSGSVAVASFTMAPAAEGESALALSEILVNDAPGSGSGGSVSIDCTQPPAAPAYLAPPNSASGLASPVTLSWSSVAGATAYRVSFGTDSTPPVVEETSGTSWSGSTATGTTYYWGVEALNVAGSSGVTQYWSFTTSGPFCAKPATPALSAPASVTSDADYALGWGTTAATDQYVLEESIDSAFTAPTRFTSQTPGATFRKTLESEATFYYRVRGRNTLEGCNVEGDFSPVVVVRVVPRPLIPAGSALLPVVGSAPGAFGSYFRTSVQLHNPGTSVRKGRIVFHTMATPATGSDPAYAFEIGPYSTVSFGDLLPQMGINSGLGSVDLLPDEGSELPLVVSRVFNDGGEKGTAGMTLMPMRLADALVAPSGGTMVTPTDPTKMRMNIGIRTLGTGATIKMVMRDKTGATVASRTVSYPPGYFVQQSADNLVEKPLPPDGSIAFAVDKGAAVIYGSTTDNTTQDTSVQFARSTD